LIEGLLFGAVHEAFEDDRAIANAAESARRNGEKVIDEVKLGDLGYFGEIEFGGVSDAQLVGINVESFNGFGVLHARLL
jgi:hypothetical protein